MWSNTIQFCHSPSWAHLVAMGRSPVTSFFSKTMIQSRHQTLPSNGSEKTASRYSPGQHAHWTKASLNISGTMSMLMCASWRLNCAISRNYGRFFRLNGRIYPCPMFRSSMIQSPNISMLSFITREVIQSIK